MNEFSCLLDQYPLQKRYDACAKYAYHQIDWPAKASEIADRGVIWFGVSDLMNLFPHLELDENYALVCYLTSEYHGIWGRVAAVRQDAPKTPVINPEGSAWPALTRGTGFKLPKEAAPPMEAVYNDGTPEGYFEALLCSLVLSALPYTRHENDRWDIILTGPPADFSSAWNAYVDIPDWRPRAIVNEGRVETLIVFRREVENGFGSSDGRDRVYLSQYHFPRRLKFHHFLDSGRRDRLFQGHIDDDSRYTDKCCCCVCAASSVFIAREMTAAAKRV